MICIIIPRSQINYSFPVLMPLWFAVHTIWLGNYCSTKSTFADYDSPPPLWQVWLSRRFKVSSHKLCFFCGVRDVCSSVTLVCRWAPLLCLNELWSLSLGCEWCVEPMSLCCNGYPRPQRMAIYHKLNWFPWFSLPPLLSDSFVVFRLSLFLPQQLRTLTWQWWNELCCIIFLACSYL